MGSGEVLNDLLRDNRARWTDIEVLDKCLHGDYSHDPPYLPSKERSALALEYNALISRSGLNVLGLVCDALVDRLQVVGFRTNPRGDSDKEVWGWWQDSMLDSRQRMIMSDAVSYRDGFVLVTPNGSVPKFSAMSPHNIAVEYDPYDPLRIVRAAKFSANRAWLYTDTHIEVFQNSDAPRSNYGLNPRGSWEQIGSEPHGGGECPVVRFGNNLDTRGRSESEIEPVLPIQRRLQQQVLDLLLVSRSQSWAQRYAAGVSVEVDEDGDPINPFPVGADRIMLSDDPDTKFGAFPQADLTGLLQAIQEHVRSIALVSRTPPHYIPSTSISNLGAETLKALEASFQAKVEERQVAFGESFEQMTRIGGRMVGVEIPTDSEVIWANRELQSEAQRADAALKLHSIGVPLEYLLEKLSLSPLEIEKVLLSAQVQETAKAKAQATAFGADGLTTDLEPEVEVES